MFSSWKLATVFLFYYPDFQKLRSQCRSNGPGNLGNLGSSKGVQPEYFYQLTTVHSSQRSHKHPHLSHELPDVFTDMRTDRRQQQSVHGCIGAPDPGACHAPQTHGNDLAEPVIVKQGISLQSLLLDQPNTCTL